MVQFFLLFSLLAQNNPDTLPQSTPTVKKSYVKQVLINGLLGIGSGAGAYLFFTKGDKAYQDYKNSETMQAAQENYNKTVFYDNVRNVLAVTSVIFVFRAVYYQLKQVKTRQSMGHYPGIDLRYAENKCMLGIRKSL